VISLFDAANAKLAVTYNSLTLNSPSDAAGATYELERVLPHTNYTTISDEAAAGDGMEMYEARKTSKAIRITGKVKGSSKADLYDRIETLAKTFDPSLISFNNPPPNDFLALDFSTPTADTTNFATGLMACRYYARPIGGLDVVPGKYSGLVVPFHLDMLLKDPRRYRQTIATITGSAAGTDIGDYPSWPTITITATGAGSATYSVKNTATIQGALTLTLNLSGLINTDVVSVDMVTRTILKNGVYAGSLYVSGSYWAIEPGVNTILVTNGTNVTTVTTYRPAWSL